LPWHFTWSEKEGKKGGGKGEKGFSDPLGSAVHSLVISPTQKEGVVLRVPCRGLEEKKRERKKGRSTYVPPSPSQSSKKKKVGGGASAASSYRR